MITGLGQMIPGKEPRILTAKNLLGHPYKPFGRMDYFSKLGFAGIVKAMKDAGRSEWQAKRNIGLIATTRFGCLETDQNYFATVTTDHGMGASPALFAYTLPNCFLGEAAIFLGLTGEGFVINETDPTGITGLSMAMTTLFEDDSMEAMVYGICDTPQISGIKTPKNLFQGALFMVLENKAPYLHTPYGALEFDASGTIIYNQETVSDIVVLAENALKGRKS